MSTVRETKTKILPARKNSFSLLLRVSILLTSIIGPSDASLNLGNSIIDAINTIIDEADSISSSPSTHPTWSPTHSPSLEPSRTPSSFPSSSPSSEPTDRPSPSPTMQPSTVPSLSPSDFPSMNPSPSPSELPSIVPSSSPSNLPSRSPSDVPSDVPSRKPSSSPTLQPSTTPSSSPTRLPSLSPSDLPSDIPSLRPSEEQRLSSAIDGHTNGESQLGNGRIMSRRNIIILAASGIGGTVLIIGAAMYINKARRKKRQQDLVTVMNSIGAIEYPSHGEDDEFAMHTPGKEPEPLPTPEYLSHASAANMRILSNPDAIINDIGVMEYPTHGGRDDFDMHPSHRHSSHRSSANMPYAESNFEGRANCCVSPIFVPQPTYDEPEEDGDIISVFDPSTIHTEKTSVFASRIRKDNNLGNLLSNSTSGEHDIESKLSSGSGIGGFVLPSLYDPSTIRTTGSMRRRTHEERSRDAMQFFNDEPIPDHIFCIDEEEEDEEDEEIGL